MEDIFAAFVLGVAILAMVAAFVMAPSGVKK